MVHISVAELMKLPMIHIFCFMLSSVCSPSLFLFPHLVISSSLLYLPFSPSHCHIFTSTSFLNFPHVVYPPSSLSLPLLLLSAGGLTVNTRFSLRCWHQQRFTNSLFRSVPGHSSLRGLQRIWPRAAVSAALVTVSGCFDGYQRKLLIHSGQLLTEMEEHAEAKLREFLIFKFTVESQIILGFNFSNDYK